MCKRIHSLSWCGFLLFQSVRWAVLRRGPSARPTHSHGPGGETNMPTFETWSDLISVHSGMRPHLRNSPHAAHTGGMIRWRTRWRVSAQPFFCDCALAKKTNTNTEAFLFSCNTILFWNIKDARIHYPWLSALMQFQGNKTFAYQINFYIISTTMSYMQTLFRNVSGKRSVGAASFSPHRSVSRRSSSSNILIQSQCNI